MAARAAAGIGASRRGFARRLGPAVMASASVSVLRHVVCGFSEPEVEEVGVAG